MDGIKTKTLMETRIKLQMESISTHISQILQEEFNCGSSFDAIIKTGYEKYETHCHKIVLALSSNFLASILNNVNSVHMPVILLPDIKTDLIHYILLYMYTGEVKVPNELYMDFIEACKLLELKGIVENIDQGYDQYDQSQADLVMVEEDTNEIESEYEEVDDETCDLIEMEEDEHASFVEDSTEEKTSFAKVRLKSEYLKNDFIPTSTFRIRDFGPKTLYSTEINKRKLPPSLREPQMKISLNDTNTSTLKEKLISSIEGAFKELEIRNELNITGGVHKVRLVVKDSKLLKGEYTCILCNKTMSVVYSVDKSGKFRQWINSNLRRHIARVHASNK